MLDINEFKDMYAATKVYSEEEIKRTFDMFDKDKNGVVSAAELAQKLSHLTSQDVESLIKEVDKNKDGNIDFKEVRLSVGCELGSDWTTYCLNSG